MYTLSVIIVSYNTKDLLRRCLQCLYQNSQGINFEIIVIDNCSIDGSSTMISSEFPLVKLVINSLNIGFGAASNQGFALAQGKYIVLLNSDAFLHANALSLSLQKMESNATIGLGGGKLLNEDGSWSPSARLFPSHLNNLLYLSGLSTKFSGSRFFGRADFSWISDEAREVDWITGAYSILRHDVLDKVGLFDERFFLYFEEVDLCRRIKAAGYKIWYWPDVVITHFGGGSSKRMEETAEDFNSIDAKLILWHMRSALLYYRKYEGVVGVYAYKLLEQGWHWMRIWKNRWFGGKEKKKKIEESCKYIQIMQKAWEDTSAGKISPPKPW